MSDNVSFYCVFLITLSLSVCVFHVLPLAVINDDDDSDHHVNGPYLLDNLMIKLRLPVVLYVSFAVGS